MNPDGSLFDAQSWRFTEAWKFTSPWAAAHSGLIIGSARICDMPQLCPKQAVSAENVVYIQRDKTTGLGTNLGAYYGRP
jgi:hypothetical protein